MKIIINLQIKLIMDKEIIYYLDRKIENICKIIMIIQSIIILIKEIPIIIEQAPLVIIIIELEQVNKLQIQITIKEIVIKLIN